MSNRLWPLAPCRADRDHGQPPGTQKRTGQNGHRDERLSTSFLDLAIHQTFLPLKRRFPSSKQPYAAQEPEPERFWKKLLAKHSSPSPLCPAQGWFQHCGYLLPGQEKKSYYGSSFWHAAVAEEKGERPRVSWPLALRAVRGWLEPWIMLRRYWSGWSPQPPPPTRCATSC
jgi:hypothetical protein